MQETVYEHVSGAASFTVTAAERWSIGQISKLKERYPDEVEIVSENADGSLVARMPADWMKIKPKRHVVRSEEQIRQCTEQLKAYRAAKKREE